MYNDWLHIFCAVEQGETMTETSEAIQIETRVFFDKYFYKFESIAGRNHEELFPENIDNYVLTGSDDYPAKIVEADKVVYSVGKAISECEDAKRKPYRTILVKCYLKQMMNREIADDLKYSSSRYSELKGDALMEFTDRFNCWLTRQDNNNPAFQLIYRKTKKQERDAINSHIGHALKKNWNMTQEKSLVLLLGSFLW